MPPFSNTVRQSRPRPDPDQPLDTEALACRRTHRLLDHRDVDLPLRQRCHQVRRRRTDQRDLDLRIGVGKQPQDGPEARAHQVVRSAKTHLVVQRRRRHLGPQLIVQPKQPARLPEQALARRRQSKAVPVTVEQGGAK